MVCSSSPHSPHSQALPFLCFVCIHRSLPVPPKSLKLASSAQLHALPCISALKADRPCRQLRGFLQQEVEAGEGEGSRWLVPAADTEAIILPQLHALPCISALKADRPCRQLRGFLQQEVEAGEGEGSRWLVPAADTEAIILPQLLRCARFVTFVRTVLRLTPKA